MKQSIAKDATKLTFVKCLTTGLAMLTAMLLSRFRTLDEYGTYSQLQLVTSLVSTIFMIGLPNSINYFLAKAETKEEKKEFLSVYYTLCTVLSLGAGVIMLLATPVVASYFKNAAIIKFGYFLALYPWTKIMLAGIENLLVVLKKMTKLMVFKILYSLVTLLVIFVAWQLDIDFNRYILFFILTEIIFTLWTYKISIDVSGGFRIDFDKSFIVKIFKFCIPIGLASIVATLSIEIDKFMIGYLYTTDQMAIYTNASKEMPVSIIASSITAVLMPELVRMLNKKKNDEAVNLWGSATIISYIVICFCAFVLVIFASDIITLLYSDKYLPGITVFRIYSLVLLFRVTYFGILLNSLGKTKFILITSLISLGLNAVLNVVCYCIWGFIGPAIATVVSIAITAFLQLLYSSRVINVSFARIFPWRKLLQITIINVVLAVIVMEVKNIIILDRVVGSLAESIFLGICWAGLYLLVVRKTLLENWNKLSSNED
ncbi:lipopolysaccharide biosynthesis protein [[Clostridium] hylemonae]|uniref:lipopolysaccharide biosynthesis protein n=1 Tax=[Clostridium] hylemonae TaxID=89153 RepID=UPI001D08A6E0|nr:oligosaccharide flippase family protein [[Clostridium] hylemonae]MCB7522157.1 oligosaccharide flippase family protein [[Clostridium] hylemonae]BDF04168.1 polysaccharide biosynthesis protein [[Clostridium] hylemonae]